MTVENGTPLVSIGVPTYNRVTLLRRAVTSALSQTYPRIEVIISDNGSTDGTMELCRSLVAEDGRVRYLRHDQNRGSTANFNALFEACQGDFVMMLADDDWLDLTYVAGCLDALRSEQKLALVAGWSQYFRNGSVIRDGVFHNHVQPDPAARVRDYLAQVDDNGVFYGLMPRRVLARARPLPNVLGNDWLHVARIAFQGQIETLDTVRIHRELDGTSVDIGSILTSFDRAAWQVRIPQLVIAGELLRDIGWSHPVYGSLSRMRRLVLAGAAALQSIRWRALAWHLLTPEIARLANRRRGRRLWDLYERLTRRLGAGGGP